MFNKGKIKVKPNVKNVKKANPKIEARSVSTGRKEIWDGQGWKQSPQRASVSHRSMTSNDLNYDVMNIPEGYHIMPDGSLMADNEMEYFMGGQPCFECGGKIPHMKGGGNWLQDIKSTGQCTGKNFGGPDCRPGTREYAFAKRARSGEFHKQLGGDSKAPQNTTIDSLGKARVDLMKNYLTANMYGSMLEQEAERLSQVRQMFNDGGSVYNPNMYSQAIYADAVDATKNQFKKDWRTFGDTLQTVVNSYPQQPMQVMNPITQPIEQVQGKQANFSNFNQEDPMNRLAMQENGFAGIDGTMAYGGNIPIAQDGINWQPQIVNSQPVDNGSMWNQNQPWNPLFTQLGYDQATEEAKWRAAHAGDSAKYAPQGIPYRVDPSGGIGQSINASGMVMTPNGPAYPYMINPSGNQPQVASRKQDPTKTFEDVGPVNSEKEYWDKVSAKKKTERSGSANTTATRRKAAESVVGKTPEQRREIEAAREAVKTNTIESVRGNFTEDDKTPSVNQSSTSGTQYYNSQPVLAPGYGGGKFKMKGIDPVTGKRFKIKYDTALSPRDVYGRRGPRVVKYDIYGNPAYQQETPMPSRMTNVDRINPKGIPSMSAPNNPQLAIPANGYTGVPQVEMPWDYVDVSSQPGEFRSRSMPYNEAVPPMMNQPTLEDQYTTGFITDPEAAALEAQYQTGFKKGGPFFPQPYPGGVEAPGTQALPYFMQDGGSFNNQGSAFLNEDAYATGPQFGSYVDDNGALVTYGEDPNQNPTMKAKWKGNNNNLNQWAPMALPAMNLISSIAEQGDRRRNEAHLQTLKQANNVFTPNTIRNRGKNTVNQGYFDPYNMTPVQFAGNDQGMIGSPNVYSKYGGAIEDGEYYLTEDEIKKVMAMGGQIEYL